MHREKYSTKRTKFILIVSAVAALFLSGGIASGLWSDHEIKQHLASQFNEEQLAIARNLSDSIGKEVRSLKKEFLLLKEDIGTSYFDPETVFASVRKTFSRVLENGVWRIEITDPTNHLVYIFVPHKYWTVKESNDDICRLLPSKQVLDQKSVWISEPWVRASGISILLGSSLKDDSPRALIFHVNLSWLLNPILRHIRSGKTGYAWLIDENGIFLFHSEANFVGKNAFKVREEKNPAIPYGKINFIQKERMLKGLEGTGRYFSGWHRGITGKIVKLIAYAPLHISENPLRTWSLAVVAPLSEIEEVVQGSLQRQLLFQGMIIAVILLGALAVSCFEIRWSRLLEEAMLKKSEELRKSEEKYRSLVESAEDFIFTLDIDGKFRSMNTFTANFFGGTAQELIGRSLASVFPEKVVRNQLELVRLVCKYGKSVRDDFCLEMGERQTWINANFMPLKNEDGQVRAVLCIARDITKNRILEKQLISAEKLASMGTIAAGVAHEINNPLGVILGFCDLLLRKADKETQAYEDLKAIERQGLHCKQVVENLLSFARLGEESLQYSDLNDCLEEIVNVVKHTIEISDIDLDMQLSREIPPVKGGSQELQQVFLNLINNAVAAMKGGGKLTIQSHYDRSTRKAIVRFQDTGSGIKEEDMEHIFEPFFTTKPEGEGTGLGLFVSYGIVAKYGGSIDCVSYPIDSSLEQKGTAFSIKLLTEEQEDL